MLHWAENGWMEFSVSTGSCRDGCGKVTQASLPEGVSSQRGPQLTALMAYLTVICRVPRRLMQRFLEVVMGISLSLGSTQKAWEEVWPQRGALLCWCACWGRGLRGCSGQAVAEPYRELEQALPQQKCSTSTKPAGGPNGDKRWLWAFVTQAFVFYTPVIAFPVIRSTYGTMVMD